MHKGSWEREIDLSGDLVAQVDRRPLLFELAESMKFLRSLTTVLLSQNQPVLLRPSTLILPNTATWKGGCVDVVLDFFKFFFSNAMEKEVSLSRGFFRVDMLKLPGNFFPAGRLVWLNRFGEGRVLKSLRVRHHVLQDPGFTWVDGKAVPKPSHECQQVIVMFLKM